MALPGYKDIVELLKKGATFEAQEKILELREAAISLQEENLALNEEINRLRGQLATKAAMHFDGHVYFQVSDKSQDGPFCPSCFDSEGKVIRVHPVHYAHRSLEWQCKVCKACFKRDSGA